MITVLTEKISRLCEIHFNVRNVVSTNKDNYTVDLTEICVECDMGVPLYLLCTGTLNRTGVFEKLQIDAKFVDLPEEVYEKYCYTELKSDIDVEYENKLNLGHPREHLQYLLETKAFISSKLKG